MNTQLQSVITRQSEFTRGDLVQHRASKRLAVVLDVIHSEQGTRYEVEPDMVPLAPGESTSWIVPEICLQSPAEPV